MIRLDDLQRAQVAASLTRIIKHLESIENPYLPQDRGKDANELRNILRKL